MFHLSIIQAKVALLHKDVSAVQQIFHKLPIITIIINNSKCCKNYYHVKETFDIVLFSKQTNVR